MNTRINGTMNNSQKSIEPLKDRVIEALRKQVEFAFESGLFRIEPDEYLVVGFTLRADTPEDIKRRYDVEFEFRD